MSEEEFRAALDAEIAGVFRAYHASDDAKQHAQDGTPMGIDDWLDAFFIVSSSRDYPILGRLVNWWY